MSCPCGKFTQISHLGALLTLRGTNRPSCRRKERDRRTPGVSAPHPVTSKARDFSRAASLSTRETDSPLERTGFELLVPRYSELSWREVSLDIRRGRRAHRLSGPLSAGRTARRRCQRSEWRRSTHRVILAHLHDVAERERSSGQANQVIRVSTQPDAQRQRSGVPARKWDRESLNPACSIGESANFRFVASIIRRSAAAGQSLRPQQGVFRGAR